MDIDPGPSVILLLISIELGWETKVLLVASLDGCQPRVSHSQGNTEIIIIQVH